MRLARAARLRALRRTARLLALAAAFGCSAGAPEPPPVPALTGPPARPDHLLLISVTGLTPERYRADGARPADMPLVSALADAGVSADAVLPVLPPTTYPAHATLVTGVDPARHGIVSDRRLGERGVRNVSFSQASHLQAPTLWDRVTARGGRVAALDWPSTVGAAVAHLLPDLAPSRRGETWLGVLQGAATPDVLALLPAAGAETPGAERPGPERDAVLVRLACALMRSPQPPSLMLLRLSQTLPALIESGAQSEAAREAFSRVDQELGRLAGCIAVADRLMSSAFVVVGDHGVQAIHTVVAPNALLVQRGLLDAGSWDAISRSNGGSAFVYAKNERAAVRARETLVEASARTGAFALISAETMYARGADPEAWFGLRAAPGFVFSDALNPPVVSPAAARAAAGYLPDRVAMQPGFVAWGRGVRESLRVPILDQMDVAPTLAALLGVELADAQGRTLVGLLGVPLVGSGAR